MTTTQTEQQTLPRAFLYVRISRDHERKGLGVDRQLAGCKVRARDCFDVSPDRIYVDNHKRAYKLRDVRSDYQRLRADIERIGRPGDVVLTWDATRMHRDVVEQGQFKRLVAQRGMNVVGVVTGTEENNAGGNLLSTIMAGISEFESAIKSERSLGKHLQLAEQGGLRGGPRPFGWRADDRSKLDPTESKLIRTAYADVLEGVSLRKIAASWNAAGARTPQSGSEWRPHVIRRLLLNPRNYGGTILAGKIIGDNGTWERTTDRETWAAVRRILTDPKRTSNGNDTRGKWLLSGLATCAQIVDGNPCGAVIRSKTATRVGTVYGCERGHLGRSAPKCDAVIRDAVLGRLGRPDAVGLLVERTVDAEALNLEAANLRAKKSANVALLRDRMIDADDLRDVNAPIVARLDEIADELTPSGDAALLAPLVTAEDRLAVWDEAMDWGQRRAVIRVLGDVTIGPGLMGGRFDVTTVVMHFA